MLEKENWIRTELKSLLKNLILYLIMVLAEGSENTFLPWKSTFKSLLVSIPYYWCQWWMYNPGTRQFTFSWIWIFYLISKVSKQTDTTLITFFYEDNHNDYIYDHVNYDDLYSYCFFFFNLLFLFNFCLVLLFIYLFIVSVYRRNLTFISCFTK